MPLKHKRVKDDSFSSQHPFNKPVLLNTPEKSVLLTQLLSFLSIYHKKDALISLVPALQLLIQGRSDTTAEKFHTALEKKSFSTNYLLISLQKHLLWHSLEVPL